MDVSGLREAGSVRLTKCKSAEGHHARARTNVRFPLRAAQSGGAGAERLPARPVGCILRVRQPARGYRMLRSDSQCPDWPESSSQVTTTLNMSGALSYCTRANECFSKRPQRGNVPVRSYRQAVVV